jgi:hypothetical protein
MLPYNYSYFKDLIRLYARLRKAVIIEIIKPLKALKIVQKLLSWENYRGRGHLNLSNPYMMSF